MAQSSSVRVPGLRRTVGTAARLTVIPILLTLLGGLFLRPTLIGASGCE